MMITIIKIIIIIITPSTTIRTQSAFILWRVTALYIKVK